MSACNVITISLEKIVSILIDSLEIVSTFVVRITSCHHTERAPQVSETGLFVIHHEHHKQFLSLFALVCKKQSTVHRHGQTGVILHDRDRNMPNTAATACK